jgi:hypothetical protein
MKARTDALKGMLTKLGIGRKRKAQTRSRKHAKTKVAALQVFISFLCLDTLPALFAT